MNIRSDNITMMQEIEELRVELNRVRQGAMDADNNVCQILGGVLSYPLGEDGQICVGPHTAETVASVAVKVITNLRGLLIEAQASASFLQQEAAQMQADERARRDAALSHLADLHSLLEVPGTGSKKSKRALTLLTSAIRILTGQDEEERREEAAGKCE